MVSLCLPSRGNPSAPAKPGSAVQSHGHEPTKQNTPSHKYCGMLERSLKPYQDFLRLGLISPVTGQILRDIIYVNVCYTSSRPPRDREALGWGHVRERGKTETVAV